MVVVVIVSQMLQAQAVKHSQNYRSDDAAGRRNRQLAANPRHSRSANPMVESLPGTHCPLLGLLEIQFNAPDISSIWPPTLALVAPASMA